MTKPTREQAEKAIKTLLAWTGDNPEREGLKETPARVARAFEEYFKGYNEDPKLHLKRTFEDIAGYDETVMLRDIQFESFCEHHLAPFVGTAHVAYIPNDRVVGISKIARVVDTFAKRLQIQEKMTVEIAQTIDECLNPKGCLVVLEANHHCMTTRGIHKPGMSMLTSRATGILKEDNQLCLDILTMLMPIRK